MLLFVHEKMKAS